MVQSCLENRTQQCSASGSLFDSRVLTCGVPRGKGGGGEGPSSVHCYSYPTWMTFQIVSQTVSWGCSLMTRILYMQIMIQVTLNHVLVRTYWIWTQTNVLKQNLCWQDVAQGLVPLLLPISHKGSHSGGTGFNEITWCNNWRQTLLELPHWKTNHKDRLWNRGHETC